MTKSTPAQAMNKHDIYQRIAQLEEFLRRRQSVLLAFSGGVDSTLLAVLGSRILEHNFLAVTVDHPCLPRHELFNAQGLAKSFAIPHKTLYLDQWAIPGFQANSAERCYLCKKALLLLLWQEAQDAGFACLMDGSNADDKNDFRPGAKALDELSVVSPLQALNWSKSEIRQASRALALPTADQPSYACLASRIPQDSPITVEKLRQIEEMEKLLHQLGFIESRARHHGDSLRLEIDEGSFAKIIAPDIRAKLTQQATELGFRWLTLDLKAYRSGSLNPK
jgi:uncharacterized protein